MSNEFDVIEWLDRANEELEGDVAIRLEFLEDDIEVRTILDLGGNKGICMITRHIPRLTTEDESLMYARLNTEFKSMVAEMLKYETAKLELYEVARDED